MNEQAYDKPMSPGEFLNLAQKAIAVNTVAVNNILKDGAEQGSNSVLVRYSQIEYQVEELSGKTPLPEWDLEDTIFNQFREKGWEVTKVDDRAMVLGTEQGPSWRFTAPEDLGD